MILDEPVLILNKGWTPINVVTVYDAMCHLVKGSAKAVDPKSFEVHDFYSWIESQDVGEKYIGTPRFQVPIPEVIVLENYDKVPLRSVMFSKKNVLTRDNYQCQYCGKELTRDNASIDHILPRSQGGQTTWVNCVASCKPCNNKKDSRTPKQAKMTLKKPPSVPRVDKEFAFAVSTKKNAWLPFLPND